ncbi:hypothetical protein MKX03_019538 [Papaver bracteatum]|nr:hypothetical protein MKX03_019538 [Papaver bracteatum]
MGFVANMASLVIYFMAVMFFDLSGAATTLTNFMGSTFLLALLGGFISDTYLTRFSTCLLFGLIELLGLMVMTFQAHYHKLQPKPCLDPPCIKGNSSLMFYASLCLYALGAGGVRGALPALGGYQFDPNDPKENKSLATYFNWLILSSWALDFLLCLVTALAGFIVVAVGKPFYLVAIRNRSLPLISDANELYEINNKETAVSDEKTLHTNQFRYLDKAAIPPKDSDIISNPWRVCTITQVEEVKILARMFPILASTIIMNTCLAQLQTISVQQGIIMDLHLGSFVVPAPSIPVIPLVFMSILIPLYQFIFVPFARKITKHPSGITQLQRVGVGLVLSAVSMAVAAVVEVKRRNQAIHNPPKPISLFWLSFQYGIFGIADMFTLVGLLEFFYKEASAGMRSLSTSFTWLSLSIGCFLSSVLVEIINAVTKHFTKRKEGWLFGLDLNKCNADLFYWFLAILSCLNFASYLYWSSRYKYKTVDGSDADTTLFEPKVVEVSKNGSPEVNKEKTNATSEDFEAKKTNAVTSGTNTGVSTVKDNEDKHDE